MEHSLPTLGLVGGVLRAFDEQGRAELVGPWGSGKTLAALQTAQALGVSLLYVAPGRIEAEAAFEDLCTFAGEEHCALLPAWEVLPTDTMEPTDDIIAERMSALSAIAAARANSKPIYVAVSARSFLQRVVDRDRLLEDSITLSLGEEHDLEDIVHRLVGMGYERELMVEQRGELSVRGGIFDVFPISAALPYRIEFFGDEIESIRRFEPETQRSVEELTEVRILPRSEKRSLLEAAKAGATLHSVADYFREDSLLAIDEPLAVAEEHKLLEAQFGESPFMTTWDDAVGHAHLKHRLDIAQVAYRGESPARVTAPMRSMAGWAGRPEGFWEQLEAWALDEYCVQLYSSNEGARRRLEELLEERGYQPGKARFDLRLAVGHLRAGFASDIDRIACVSEREIFGRKYVRRSRRRFTAGAAITTFSDLKAGDYIVHVDHGIGRYLGLRRFSGKRGDFLGVQYGNNDILYVPVSHIDMVQKYVGGDGAVPKIDKLGGATWAKTRAKVKKAVQDMTEELLKLYAARTTQHGHAFNKDTHWQHEFEDSFEYEETPDQIRAIAEIKSDMESDKPMERLLCGDVGFGKTEVAMRAAFKTVMDGKQVAVLVPTTLLAEQHYMTFKERFAGYPVKIEFLSRFRTAAEQKIIVHALKDGELDIVIGTHRLTSGDINFKNLGLVILDEEQRFGVKHKEKLKQLRTNVDVLSLSATPIPRTLHMSLSGVRDMSVINTAPNDRLPIHTRIDVFDKDVIREAITRELARQGQVFYLHNRVQTIAKVATMVRDLVPHARVAVGHGQMNETELESVMTKFINKELDVLVCTTIIGSGIDIPNANTIIVDRADQFGLSELYQLRGRVGRYKHRAFAYLLVPDDRALTEEAQKRLKALEEFSALGVGFQIAMRDLEIRGAGNMLGHQQSGQIAAVGYDTYTQLVQETVAEIKGDPVKTAYLPPFDAGVDGHIPEDYVPSEAQKIALYKRIASLRSLDDVDEMRAELTDRFGAPPAPVERLLQIMKVRALAGEAGARRIVAGKTGITIEFDSAHVLDDEQREAIARRCRNRVQFAWKERPSVTHAVENGDDPVKIAQDLLAAIV